MDAQLNQYVIARCYALRTVSSRNNPTKERSKIPQKHRNCNKTFHSYVHLSQPHKGQDSLYQVTAGDISLTSVQLKQYLRPPGLLICFSLDSQNGQNPVECWNGTSYSADLHTTDASVLQTATFGIILDHALLENHPSFMRSHAYGFSTKAFPRL